MSKVDRHQTRVKSVGSDGKERCKMHWKHMAGSLSLGCGAEAGPVGRKEFARQIKVGSGLPGWARGVQTL